MRHSNRIPVFLQILLTLAFIAPAGLALANSADLKIRLTSAPGFKAVQASAKYRNRGGKQTFEAEVSNAVRLAGLTLSVSVDGNKVGTFKVSRLGVGQLELESERGQTVPRIRTGSFVEIKLASGVLVASGRF